MDWWSRLKVRERAAVVALGAAVLFGVYSKAFREPMSKSVLTYQTQIKKSEAQLNDLKTKAPQDEELKEKIQSLKDETDKMTAQIDSLEENVPSTFGLTQLVGEFTRLANDVKLESVKQRVVKEQNYSRVFLEVKFYSNYANAIHYLASLETLSPFLKLEEMEMLEPKGKSVELGGAPVRLLMSCLLSDKEEGLPLKAADVAPPPASRDILSSSERPQTELEDTRFKLQGISFNLKNPTAIINDDVYAVGAEIGGLTVKKILPDSVVLSDGSQDHVLNLTTKTTEKKK